MGGPAGLLVFLDLYGAMVGVDHDIAYLSLQQIWHTERAADADRQRITPGLV
jgi:hypothetical protein